MTRSASPSLLYAIVVFAAIGLGQPSQARAQNWSGDARSIAMGGVGTGENLAWSMVENDQQYRTIVIPLGLIQVLRDTEIFKPGSDRFDPIRSVEYAAAPLHYTFDRDGTGSGATFVNDLRNAELSTDLNNYRGFVPVSQPVTYGLAAPRWGATIPVRRSDFNQHGVYVGAGPYLAFRGALDVDEGLIEVLESDVDVYRPNTAFPIASEVSAGVAVAITGGYRGRFGLDSGRGDEREGVYVAVNYSYLLGFRHEDQDIGLRLDTDAAGLLTVNPLLPAPIRVLRTYSSSGRGHVVDVGAIVFYSNWEVGGGVSGIANRIEWTGVRDVTYTLGDVFNGGDFDESEIQSRPDIVTKQPVEYTGNVGYHAERWSAVAQVSQRTTSNPSDEGRFSPTTFRTGFEYRFLRLEPRVGIFHSRERWIPSAGLGLNLGNFGIDGAVYWMDANVQRVRHPAFALSLRIGSRGR